MAERAISGFGAVVQKGRGLGFISCPQQNGTGWDDFTRTFLPHFGQMNSASVMGFTFPFKYASYSAGDQGAGNLTVVQFFCPDGKIRKARPSPPRSAP
jgi:hypothetical protein